MQTTVWLVLVHKPLNLGYIPYDSLSSYHFQIGIGSPRQHLFDRQFCVGLLHIFCKQWPRGRVKILKFWPLHSVRQNVAGFRRGLFTCFLGHTPFYFTWNRAKLDCLSNFVSFYGLVFWAPSCTPQITQGQSRENGNFWLLCMESQALVLNYLHCVAYW